MEGWLAFGSVVFLWIFIKMILSSNKVDVKSDENRNNETKNKRRRNNEDAYKRHLEFMRNSERNSPAYSHLPDNIWNND